MRVKSEKMRDKKKIFHQHTFTFNYQKHKNILNNIIINFYHTKKFDCVY